VNFFAFSAMSWRSLRSKAKHFNRGVRKERPQRSRRRAFQVTLSRFMRFSHLDPKKAGEGTCRYMYIALSGRPANFRNLPQNFATFC